MKVSRLLIVANIALILLCMLSIFRLNQQLGNLRGWVMGLQETAWCTSVKEPCQKCGCNVYNTLVYNFDVIRTRCAKCGEPHPKALSDLEKFWNNVVQNKLIK